jgi:hypothetical protein
MTLRSAKFLTNVDDQPMQFNGGPGWQQISAGLRLVAWGYTALLIGSIVGVLLVWVVLSGHAVFGPRPSDDYSDQLLLFAVLTLGLTAIVSYGLVLAGQWRCLMYAPQRGSAKELIYVCLHCVLIGSVLNGVGAYLDGGKTYAALQQGWEGLHALDAWSPANMVQAGSLLLGVAGSLVFSQFLRNVAECFNDRRAARAVDFNLLFMGLLIGGSVGTHLFIRRLSLQGDTLPWLIGGWLLCFAWHLGLVIGVRWSVDAGLRRLAVPRHVPPPVGVAGAVLTHTLSGLRRIARNASA